MKAFCMCVRGTKYVRKALNVKSNLLPEGRDSDPKGPFPFIVADGIYLNSLVILLNYLLCNALLTLLFYALLILGLFLFHKL